MLFYTDFNVFQRRPEPIQAYFSGSVSAKIKLISASDFEIRLAQYTTVTDLLSLLFLSY